MIKKAKGKKLDIGNWEFSHFAGGQILIIAIIFLAVVLILSAALFGRLTNFLHFGATSIYREQAVNIAEAGIDKALLKLNETAGSYTGETDTQVGTTGTFTITVTNKGQNLKTITATGYIPNSTNYKNKQTIKLEAAISSDIVAFNYAVQAGSGGFNINNSTVNGNAYAGCPNPCTPANIIGSNNAKINGSAFATGPTITPYPDLDVKYSRNPNQSNPPSLPVIGYAQWKTAAISGDSPSVCNPGHCTVCPGGQCDISSTGNMPTQKYVGNVTISGGTTTLQGPVYVTGNFSINNGATMKLDNSFGSNDTVFIIDGTVSTSSGSIIVSTSTNPKGYIFFVTTSTAANAMTLNGGGQGNPQNGVFYALDGTVNLSEGINLTAAVGKTISMTGGSVLNYDNGLAVAQFSSGPGGSWQIKKGTYHFK